VSSATTDSAEFHQAVAALGATVGVSSTTDAKTLELIQAVVETKLNPQALKNAGQGTQDPKSKGGAPSAVGADLSMFRLGFDTGSTDLNHASTVLKMMYIADLRNLQTDINNMIVTAQEYTARPKTDTSLGKVGYG
jgi:RLL motif-containing protein 1